MKTIMLILSVVLILLGLLMLLVTPAGFALIALGIVALIYFSRKSPNSKPEEKAAHIPAPESDKAPQADPDAAQRETPAPEKSVRAESETFRVAGVTYHVDELMSLAEDNPYYDYSKRDLIDGGLTDERVYEYAFYPQKVELEDEPDNEADPKAIKVVIDGQHVGYIKKGSTGRIRNLRKQGRIKNIEAEIDGGKYKIVFSDEDEDGREHYDYDKDESPFSVKLTLHLYPEQ